MDPNILEEPEAEMIEDNAPELKTEEQKMEEKEEREALLKKIQDEALEKQKNRNEAIGELLRSKGFFWQATSNVSIKLYDIVWLT